MVVAMRLMAAMCYLLRAGYPVFLRISDIRGDHSLLEE